MNAEIVTIWDENYPNLLKKIFDPPLLLQIKGSLSESDQYAIAMVGTRQPTNYGKVLAERISSDLAEQNITIVSGMARGIDSIGHSSAIKKGGRTVAVIGSGLDVIYPPENGKLYEQICDNGAVISEFCAGNKSRCSKFSKKEQNNIRFEFGLYNY